MIGQGKWKWKWLHHSLGVNILTHNKSQQDASCQRNLTAKFTKHARSESKPCVCSSKNACMNIYKIMQTYDIEYVFWMFLHVHRWKPCFQGFRTTSVSPLGSGPVARWPGGPVAAVQGHGSNVDAVNVYHHKACNETKRWWGIKMYKMHHFMGTGIWLDMIHWL